MVLRIVSDNMPSKQAVPCEATLEDLYLYYFPTEEGGQQDGIIFIRTYEIMEKAHS